MTKELSSLKKIWLEEEIRADEAKGFSYIDGEWDSDGLPWNYRDLVFKYLKKTDRLLDLDTVDGEFLLTLNHPFSLTGIAEAFDDNYNLCKLELEPLGITVKKTIKSKGLPYEDGIFDVVHNRNGSFDGDEVYRVLKPGGYFITQQIDGRNDMDLSSRIIEGYKPAFPDYSLDKGLKLLEDRFEIIEKDEGAVSVRFYDVKTVIAFAKLAKTEFPNFSVEEHFDKLVRLQLDLEEQGHISTTQYRFMIVARKPYQ